LLSSSSFAPRIEWPSVEVFWGDERCVPPDHPESNYGMVAASLLRHVAIVPGNLHRIRCEDAADLAAARHDAELAEFFGRASPDAGGAGPTFDLVLLGLGADGHTTSLFPGSPALDATGWVVAARAPGSGAGAERVTLTLPAINSAREGVFLVAGAAKRGVVRRLFRTESFHSGDPPLPAARVRPRGGALWLLDAAAGAGFQP
jgi:6-phosphogluconolactonase